MTLPQQLASILQRLLAAQVLRLKPVLICLRERVMVRKMKKRKSPRS